MGDKVEGTFRCGPCKWSSNPDDKLEVQEEQLYQHNRDVEHDGKCNKPCQNCGKQEQREFTKMKVPQPTSDVKNPKSPVVFCNDKCRKEYLKKMGIVI